MNTGGIVDLAVEPLNDDAGAIIGITSASVDIPRRSTHDGEATG